MQDGPSTLSLIAAAFYGLVLISCLLASHAALKYRQQHWHLGAWLAVSALFVLLITFRLFDLEEMTRSNLRDWLSAEGLRSERRQYQGAIFALLTAIAMSGVFYGSYRIAQRLQGRRNYAVVISIALSAAMVVLVVLRVLSLHAVDQLLFGPMKLNWFSDVGASAGILVGAIFYTRRVRGR